MSDPRAKAERSRVKTIRQGGIDQREHLRSVSKKDKPVVVECRWLKTGWLWRALGKNSWHTFGRYRDEATANKVIADQHRKNPEFYEFRLRPHK